MRTIARAMEMAESGDVVHPAPGTYHEDVRMRAGVTLLGDPAQVDSVVLDGASEIRSWTAVDGAWETPWTLDLPRITDERVLASRPEAGRPEMVFVDGEQLVEVADRAALTEGTFFVDQDADVLVLADDPTGHLVEASTLSGGVDMQSADGARLSGLTVRRFASNADDIAAVRVYASDVIIDAVQVLDNAAMGVSVIGDRVVLDGVSSSRNGYIDRDPRARVDGPHHPVGPCVGRQPGDVRPGPPPGPGSR